MFAPNWPLNPAPKIAWLGTSNSRQSSRWNQGCLFPYQDTTVSDIIISSKMCLCFTKTLARGRPLDPLKGGEGKHGEATAGRGGAAEAHGRRAGHSRPRRQELRERTGSG